MRIHHDHEPRVEFEVTVTVPRSQAATFSDQLDRLAILKEGEAAMRRSLGPTDDRRQVGLRLESGLTRDAVQSALRELDRKAR